MININGIILETERLIIREFKISDLEDFYEYSKVEGVGEAAGWPHHKNVEESKEILLEFVNSKNVFAIYNKKDMKVIGSVGLHSNYNKDIFSDYINLKVVEIGYVLSKDYWLNGFMTEALNILIKYVFNELNYDIIVAGYFEGNFASEKTQKKLGFKDYKKSVYYSKLLDTEFTITNTILMKK